MNQRTEPCSIILSGMLEMNRNLKGPACEATSFLGRSSFESLAEHLAGIREPWLLTIEVDDFYSHVAQQDDEQGFMLLDTILAAAQDGFAMAFPHSRLLNVQRSGIGEYAIFFAPEQADAPRLMEGYAGFHDHLAHAVVRFAAEYLGREVRILVGLARLEHWNTPAAGPAGLERAAFRAFCEAKRLARHRPDSSKARLHREFLDILKAEAVEMHYQPILDLRGGQVLGWEAFLRGPLESPLREPQALLTLAEELGELFRLERICRSKAVQGFASLAGKVREQKLFLNAHATTLNDPCQGPGPFREMLAARNLEPQCLVLEFSERQGSMDLNLLLRKLESYRKEGFKVAVDDVGAGHSSLRSLSQIRPDYIKADISLVSGVAANPFKRVMVETLVLLAEKIGSVVVAEGVQTEAEYRALLTMGVPAGQGHLFARPEPVGSGTFCTLPHLPEPPAASQAQGEDWKCSTPVETLAEKTLTVTPEETVHEVKRLLSGDKPLSSIVVVQGQRPVGLVMSYHLDRHLGTQYGVALYYRRSVSLLMDGAPLVVDIGQPVEEVAKLAMNRDSQKIYDDIVVVSAGRFVGTVSVQKLLDTLAQVQVELAKGSNPLSGLPGNVSIELEINRRAKEKQPASLIYVDLDNFKVYNDVYGFNNGDKVILLIARVLKEALRVAGSADDFLGHVGGDDFILIAGQDRAEAICRQVAEQFGREVPELYNAKDREAGFVMARGRDGQLGKFPFITVSMGIVDCQFLAPFSMEEMSQRVAEIKKYSKSRPGNSYVRDRRAPLGAG